MDDHTILAARADLLRARMQKEAEILDTLTNASGGEHDYTPASESTPLGSRSEWRHSGSDHLQLKNDAGYGASHAIITSPEGNAVHTMNVTPPGGVGRRDLAGRTIRNGAMFKLRPGEQLPSPEALHRTLEQHFNFSADPHGLPAVDLPGLNKAAPSLPPARPGEVPLNRSVQLPGRGKPGWDETFKPSTGASYGRKEIPALAQHPTALRVMRRLGMSKGTVAGQLGRGLMRRPGWQLGGLAALSGLTGLAGGYTGGNMMGSTPQSPMPVSASQAPMPVSDPPAPPPVPEPPAPVPQAPSPSPGQQTARQQIGSKLTSLLGNAAGRVASTFHNTFGAK